MTSRTQLLIMQQYCHTDGDNDGSNDAACMVPRCNTTCGPACNFKITPIPWPMGYDMFWACCSVRIHSLTHSLVDLPRWGLATADDHSDIFLLHCVRSCDISFSWMYSQPVRSSMSCIHCLPSLPWCRSPSTIPSRTVSANCPALPRVIWPKYCSFSFATLPINSLQAQFC